MAFYGAFLMGLLGSFHCIGMCGPIAVALPGKGKLDFRNLLNKLVYNGGRIIMYMLLGVLFGLFGKGLLLAGLQQYLSILAGIMILAFYFLPKMIQAQYRVAGYLNKYVVSKMKVLISNSFKQSSFLTMALIGFFNGLLPCGLVYMAVVGAIATGDPVRSSLFMGLFGLGTLPAMLSIAIAGNVFRPEVSVYFKKAIPYFVLLIGVLFILRGLNLGIPYVSPELTGGTPGTSCH